MRIRNPGAVRPWQHVLEPLGGYLLLAERLWSGAGKFAHGWNFGPSNLDARPVAEVMDEIARMWGAGLRWETDAAGHPHEAALLRLDSSLAREQLGWRPRLDLKQALQWTVDWYKACLLGKDMAEAEDGASEEDLAEEPSFTEITLDIKH